MQDLEKMSQEELLEKLDLLWPQVFPVCEEHKGSFFSDYPQAVVHKDGRCELCDARDNDSLGG